MSDGAQFVVALCCFGALTVVIVYATLCLLIRGQKKEAGFKEAKLTPEDVAEAGRPGLSQWEQRARELGLVNLNVGGAAAEGISSLMRRYASQINVKIPDSNMREAMDANDLTHAEAMERFRMALGNATRNDVRLAADIWRQPRRLNSHRRILILGAPRSYTSAMAESLAIGLGVPMFFEPFHPQEKERLRHREQYGIRNEGVDIWKPGMDCVEWVKSLPEDGFVVKDLVAHSDAFRLPRELPEGLVDEILIPRREPMQGLCSWALARDGRGWLSPDPMAEGNLMDARPKLEVTPEIMEEFRTQWLALELLVYNCEHHFKGKFQIINATDYRAVADKLVHDGYTLGKNVTTRRVRPKLPSECIANMDAVRKFVDDHLREIQLDATWREEAVNANWRGIQYSTDRW